MTKLKRMQPLLGTYVEVGVETERSDVNDVITNAFKHIKNIQRLLSFQDPCSELSQLNRSRCRDVILDPISADVLRLALHLTGVTNGAFNCTVGGALVQKGVLPNHVGGKIISSGTADDVILDGCKARLVRPVRITLDGIAKGYAVDQAVNFLKRQGVKSGWVNAGGDLRVFGDISIPVYRREIEGNYVSLGTFSEISIATSSVEEKYNKRFPSMLFDDKSQSFKSGIWSVKANSLWLADALTKVASVTPKNLVNKVISQLGGELLYSISL